jgi:hypothetical protein
VRDDDLNELYRAPLEKFTAARDALARAAGANGREVKKLQKPTLPAWAVNQVYWKRRKTFDRLAYAADRLRTAHRRRLGGKDADVEDAERTHEAAVAAATDEAREILEQSGDAVAPATVTAVAETFRAFPWAEAPGRLTRPLKPGGFEALKGLLPKGAAERPLASIVRLEEARREQARRRATQEDAERDRRERQRESASIQTALRQARQDARRAEGALERRRRAVEQAEAARAEFEARLERATANLQSLRQALATETRHASAATAEVRRLEDRLAALSDEKR